MTGIERLRRVAEAQDMRNVWTAMLSHELSDIADQIERERACDADTIENIRLIVGVVIDDMERHILGHEGMEDSPVARWARELREALGALHAPGFQKSRKVANSLTSHSDASDVSMSAYDLLPQEERDAIAWVRDHGGLDHVRAEWISRVPHDLYEARRRRLLGHIAECETALGRRRRRISKLGHRVSDLTRENAELRRRAMPEGYEWPRYESGEPLRYEDRYVYDGREREVWHVDFDSYGEPTILNKDGTRFHPDKGERVKRPAVLAADGEPLEVGQTVWWLNNPSCNLTVDRVDSPECVSVTDRSGDETQGLSGIPARELTHQRPVLDADGVPIREGDTVWSVNDGTEYKVGGIKVTADVDGDPCKIIECSNDELHIYYVCIPPDKLTHTKPEPKRFCRDCAHWQKDPTANNMGVCWFLYHEYEGQDCYSARLSDIGACEEFMPSARALAERERGE